MPRKRKRSEEGEAVSSPSSHDFGLNTIRPPPLPYDSFNLPINIIFVHGLGESPTDTWTDNESGAFWPLWLSEINGLENTRIMTFGYDSGWNKFWKPNNVLDLSDFAKQLVHALWLHYMEHGDVLSFWIIAKYHSGVLYLSLMAWAAS